MEREGEKPHLHVDIAHQPLDVVNLPPRPLVPLALGYLLELCEFEDEDALGLLGVRDGARRRVRDKLERERGEHVQLRERAVVRGQQGREDRQRGRVLADGVLELFCARAWRGEPSSALET